MEDALKVEHCHGCGYTCSLARPSCERGRDLAAKRRKALGITDPFVRGPKVKGEFHGAEKFQEFAKSYQEAEAERAGRAQVEPTEEDAPQEKTGYSFDASEFDI